jgi:hypothetical protein
MAPPIEAARLLDRVVVVIDIADAGVPRRSGVVCVDFEPR